MIDLRKFKVSRNWRERVLDIRYDGFYVITIREDGTFYRSRFLGPQLGFVTEAETQRIQLREPSREEQLV